MYKLYSVTRTDEVDYDEYDECVVVAKDEEEDFKLATIIITFSQEIK